MRVLPPGENPSEFPSTETLHTVVRETLASDRIAAAAPSVSDAVDRLYDRIDHARPTVRVAVKQVAPRYARAYWSALVIGAAAVFAVAIGTVAVRRNTPAAAPRVSTYATNNGERATVSLPDGSTVILNVASRLEVPTNYANGNRRLRLTGEAFFTVTPNANAPFTVEAGGETARVIGTRFSVRRYRTDTLATFAVLDGKVSVRNTVLSAAQQVRVTRTRVSAVTPADDATFAFSRGVLALEGQTLAELIPELNRWYNVDLRLGDVVLGTRHWEANLEAGSPADLTVMLEMTFNVRVVRNGRTLTLFVRQ